MIAKHLGIAAVGSALLVVIISAVGVVPFGNEPLEIPWRITATLIIGLLIGISAGFVWLRSFQEETAFDWRVLSVAFVLAGFTYIEVQYCLTNDFVSINTFPVLLMGTISIGTLLGALVKSLQ